MLLHSDDSGLGTGTHDNETMEGWLKDSATDKDKAFIQRYLGVDAITDVSWLMIREAFKSVSRSSIVMMQAGTSALGYPCLLSQHYCPVRRVLSGLPLLPQQQVKSESSADGGARPQKISATAACGKKVPKALFLMQWLHLKQRGKLACCRTLPPDARSCGIQDVLRLDNSARMNFPGTVVDNWTWRIGEADVWVKLTQEAADLHLLAETFDRLAPSVKTHKP